MFGHLLQTAKNDNINEFEVALITLKKEELLLLEGPYLNQQNFYRLPTGLVLKDESLSQAIQRVLMQEALLAVGQVEHYLAYHDSETERGKKRSFYFVVTPLDPEDLATPSAHSFAWAKPEDAVGYPISSDLREMLDLFMRQKKAS